MGDFYPVACIQLVSFSKQSQNVCGLLMRVLKVLAVYPQEPHYAK